MGGRGRKRGQILEKRSLGLLFLGRWTDTSIEPGHNSDPKVAPTLFPMSSFSPETGSSVVLGCLAQGFFPVPVNMTWTFSGSKGSVRSYPAMLSGSTYSQSSVLDLPADQCTESQSYECHVDHYGISATVNVPCKASISCCCPCTLEPSVSLSAPSLESLLLGKGVNLTCTLSGLKSKDGIKFTWTRTPTQELTLNAIQGTPEQDSSGRYSVSSILEIFAEEWTHGNTFSCTVSHPEIETTTKTIFKPNVPQIPPQVYLLPPSADELALNELVSIICLVRSFSPNEVMIQWLKGNENLPKKDYIINGPYPESRGSNTFLLTSIIQVLASDWNAESKYSCVVGHEALPLNFTQKTIDRYSDHWKEIMIPNCLNEDFVEEDDREATLWPMTVTFLTLFLLSMFYNTTVTLIKTKSGPPMKY